MANLIKTPTFVPGPRLIDGADLNSIIAQVNAAFAGSAQVSGLSFSSGSSLLFSTSSGLVAKAGGGRTGATAITSDISQVATVATAADSLVLPPAVVGMEKLIINNGANAAQVFASGSDTIDGTAGATGISQPAAAKYSYVCASAGKWISFKSA